MALLALFFTSHMQYNPEMIDGISEGKKERPVKAVKDDSKMSLSHLLLHGYVIDEVVDGRFRAKFRSLRVEEVQDINREVVHVNGPTETRSSIDMRNNKILSKSLMFLSVKDEAGIDLYNKDFTQHSDAETEGELRKSSAIIYNKTFSMYMKFEAKMSELTSENKTKN